MERPDFPKSIDSSSRKTFASCPIKFYYEYCLHLKPKGESIHLHFGACLAHGLEVFRKAFYGEGLDFSGSMNKAATAIILQWGEFEPPEKSKKTLESCLDCLFDYFVQYPPDDDPVRPMMIGGKPTVEWSFALPIPGILHPQTNEPILYTGRFDMLAEYQGACFVDDEKTATQLGGNWSNSYQLSSQFSGYVWAARQFGYNCRGAIVRGISPLVSSVNHQMLILYRPDWMINRWQWQLNRDVKRMIKCWEDNQWDYAIDDACGNYGGCAYLGLCEVEDPKGVAEIYYERRVWDPLAKLEGE